MKRISKFVRATMITLIILAFGVFSVFAVDKEISEPYTLYTNTGAAYVITAYKAGTSASASADNSSTATTNTNIILRRSVGGSVKNVATAIATPGSTSKTATVSYDGSDDATWAAVASPSAKLGAGTYFCSGTITLTYQ